MTPPSTIATPSGVSKAFGEESTAHGPRQTPKAGKPKRPKGSPRFSMRLSAPERARLEEDAKAAGMALASYVKLRLFHNIPGLPQPRPNRPAADTQMIARLLAVLGEARLSQNLNQLAKAANMGTLDVSPATENELVSACAEVQAMRRDLVTALGLKT